MVILVTKLEFDQYLDNLISKIHISYDDDDVLEMLFLKIFIKFQLYITELFISYAVGISSEKGFAPKRLLNFSDKETMEKFLKIGKKYVDYYELAINSSYVFFEDNPFSILSETTNYSNALREMVSLRNYLAHESDESKKSYITKCLYNNSFIRPAQFLRKTLKSEKITYLTSYIDKIKEISELLLDKPLV